MSQHGQIGCDTPRPGIRTRAIPAKQKRYLGDACAIPYENKAKRVRYPLCGAISKGYCAIWGVISHWAAKVMATHVRHMKNESGAQLKEIMVLVGVQIGAPLHSMELVASMHPRLVVPAVAESV